ncbi:MAG: SDR family oxidoreductase [Actinomycetota bacterium]
MGHHDLPAEGPAALVLDDQHPEGARVVADRCGPSCEVMVAKADVRDHDRPDGVVAEALERFGRIDVALTSAGMSVGRALVDTSPEEWDDVFAVNVRGTYLWLRAVIPTMVERGSGSLIAIASQLAVNGGRANTAYIASKGAVISMIRTTALDLARTGVRANALLPGATETPLLDRSFGRLDDPERARAASLARHPMGRFGRPEEIAAAAVYLASDESSFTTGTEIRVDGGWIAG